MEITHGGGAHSLAHWPSLDTDRGGSSRALGDAGPKADGLRPRRTHVCYRGLGWGEVGWGGVGARHVAEPASRSKACVRTEILPSTKLSTSTSCSTDRCVAATCSNTPPYHIKLSIVD